MKESVIVFVICLLAAYGTNSHLDNTDKYIIETVVTLHQDNTNEVLEFFKSTNPKLVSGESVWIRASFSTIERKDIVVVKAE